MEVFTLALKNKLYAKRLTMLLLSFHLLLSHICSMVYSKRYTYLNLEIPLGSWKVHRSSHFFYMQYPSKTKVSPCFFFLDQLLKDCFGIRKKKFLLFSIQSCTERMMPTFCKVFHPRMPTFCKNFHPWMALLQLSLSIQFIWFYQWIHWLMNKFSLH